MNFFVTYQIALFAFAALASAQQAAKYPAGVDPSRCPNFPICDNAALHAPAHAPQHWAPQAYHAPAPQWYHQPAPQWQPAPAAYHAPAPAGGKLHNKIISGLITT